MHQLHRLHNLSSQGIPTQLEKLYYYFLIYKYSFYEQHSIEKDNSPIRTQF